MKSKNKILSSILSVGIISSGFAGALSFPSKNFCSYGESNVLGTSVNEKHRQYEVEGFELVRVIEDEVDNNIRFAHFRHEKTGAQVVVCLGENASNDSSARFYFKVPTDNNNGVKHVLEHLIPSPLWDDVGRVTAYHNEYFININLNDTTDQELFSRVLTQIKNPDFKNSDIDESVRNRMFDLECHHEYTGKDGQTFHRGRIYHEVSNCAKHYPTLFSPEEYAKVKVFMPCCEKIKCFSWGTPESIKKTKREDAEKMYNDYIHPSNSFICISGMNWKDTVEKIESEYLNEYDKREFNVSYDFDEDVEVKDFSRLKIKKWEEFVCGQDEVQYKALIGYDLGILDEKEFEAAAVMMYKIPMMGLIQRAGYITYGLDLYLASNNHTYIRVDLLGNEADCFEEEILESVVHDCIGEVVSYIINQVGEEYVETLDTGRFDLSERSVNNMANHFALFDDPFISADFRVENNKLKHVYSASFLDIIKLLESKVKTPTQIMVFEKDDKGGFVDKTIYVFQLTNMSETNMMLNGVVRAICSNFIDSYTHDNALCYETPMVYDGMILTREESAVPGLRDFFKNDLPDIFKNFKVTPEMLESVKEMLREKGADIDEEELGVITVEDVENLIKGLSVSYLGEAEIQ